MESAGSIIISGIIDGSDGYSSAAVQLFRRSAQALGNSDRPTGTLTYTFATGVLSGTASYFNGWSQSIPAASEGTKLYVTMATARSQSATDTIVGNPAGQGDNEWSTPVEYVADGMAYASVTIYKRYPSAPTDKPADNSKFYFKTVGSIKAGTLVAPSGGSLNDWSTEMPATNANHDPCWVRHATAVANTTDDYDEIGVSEWSDAVKMVEDGESSWVADLDNEMDSVSCDDIGKPVAEQTVETRISLYSGSGDKDFKITSITRNNSSSMGTGVTVSPTASSTIRTTPTTFQVTYATMAQISGKDDFAITIQAVDGSNITKTLHFTVNGVIGDVYNLLPSVNEIAFSVDPSTNNYTPDPYELTCGYTENKKGVITENTGLTKTANSGNVTYHMVDDEGHLIGDQTITYNGKYNIFYKYLDSNGQEESGDWKWLRGAGQVAYTEDNVIYYKKLPTGIISISANTTNGGVVFILTNATSVTQISTSNIIDREKVHIVRSGKKGDGGAVATVTPGEISVQCDKDGNVTAAINSQALSFGLTVGGDVCTDVKAALKGSQPRGVSLVSSGGTVTAISISTSVSGSAVKDTDFAAGVSFTVSGKDSNNKNVTADCTLGLKGQRQGAKGDATPVYDLVFDTYQAVFDVQSMKLTASFGLYVRKAEGTVTPSYIVTYTPQYLDPGTGEWTNLSGPSSSKYSKTLTNVTLSEIPKSIDFRVIDSNNKLLCTTAMPISIKGVQGELGKMCYIAGICKDDTEYTSNAQQTVAVEVQATSGTETQIWYLDASTNKVTVGGRTVYVTPENQGKDGIPIVWKQGLNNYNLIRTKYLFADFAKLGEGVVSGDWLFSASGKINGTSYGASQKHGGVTAYMAFNASDPHGDGVVKVSGESRSLAYNYYESDYFGYMELTRGRDLKIRAKGKRNYYSENVVYLRLYLYKDGEYTQMASLSWDTSYDVEKELIYTILESGTYYLCVEHSYTSYSSYGSSVISDIYVTEYGFAPNYAVDLKMGKSYQNDAYLKGKIEAGSGSIGGFDIGANDLKNINYDAGITIQDKESYPTKVVKIGADASDEMTGRESAMVAEATEANTDANNKPYNTALYLNAMNAIYNYAFHGNGNGVLNGLIFGFKIQRMVCNPYSSGVLPTYANANKMILREGATVILQSNTSGGLYGICLPLLSDVRKSLGILKNVDTVDFAIEINIINQIKGEPDGKIIFRNNEGDYNRDELPWLMSNDNTKHIGFTGFDPNFKAQIGQGDVQKYLLVYDTVSTDESGSKLYYRAYDLIRRQ